jgi:hypothetical protein
MIKLIVPFLNMLVLLILQVFQGDVSVKMDVPALVNAGSEFEIKITLQKGDLEGFSRFQQHMPAGLTAISGVTSNADFSFTDKRVRFIWLRIPQNNEITVSYKVKVEERLKGTFTLGGMFSYIEDNERKSLDIEPVSITITPSSTIDPSLQVDINDYDKMALPAGIQSAVNPSAIACIRQTPFPGERGDYIVKVLVNKESTRSFAKIEEDVPEGYTAVALDAKDAIFTFKGQKVKFLWMNMPLDPYFTVSYRLIPKNQTTPPAPVMSGAFSYLVDEKTISLPIIESNKDLASLNTNQVNELVVQARLQPAANQSVVVSEPDKPLLANAETKTGPGTRKPVSAKPEQTMSQLAPSQGVYYRIQLAAGHKPVEVDRYFKKLKLNKEIRKETHDGWQKYSVGSFTVYKEARDYRIHIWNTTPVKDAFVTAYNGDRRITVQEALMVTEQQWYR